MNTLTVRIESLDDVGKAVADALRNGKAETGAGLSFASYEDLHRILAPKRMEIVRAMAGQGALSYREVARRVDRDYKGVHSDLTSLVQAGVVDRVEDGVIFPYGAIHFAFEIKADAA